MSIEEKLRNYILYKFGSLKKFCSASGLSQSTLSTLFSRGLMNCTTDKFFKMCRTLNISADELAEGKIVELLDDDSNSELTNKYGRLTNHSRGLVNALMDYELNESDDEEPEENLLIAASGAENFDEEELKLLEKDIEMVKNLGKNNN